MLFQTERELCAYVGGLLGGTAHWQAVEHVANWLWRRGVYESNYLRLTDVQQLVEDLCADWEIL